MPMKNIKLKVNSPCKDCEERHTACWDTCAAYQQYCKEKDELKEMRYKDVNMVMCTYEHDQITRALRWKKRYNYKMRD